MCVCNGAPAVTFTQLRSSESVRNGAPAVTFTQLRSSESVCAMELLLFSFLRLELLVLIAVVIFRLRCLNVGVVYLYSVLYIAPNSVFMLEVRALQTFH